MVPLSNFITREPVAKLGQINRVDQQRYFDVKADVMPGLVSLEGNDAEGGNVWMAPFDWGQTSVTYRTDLFELEGEESWDMLWDERYSGRLGSLASGADAWWCGAIKAGVDFADIATDEAFEKIAAVMREQRPLIRVYTDDTTTLEQALAAGEMVAAMTWNSSAVQLQSQEVPVKFAKPKEGALTWVCGLMIHKDAPNVDRAYDVIDSLLSVESGKFMINDYGYGHSNARAFDARRHFAGRAFPGSADAGMGNPHERDVRTDQGRLLSRTRIARRRSTAAGVRPASTGGQPTSW